MTTTLVILYGDLDFDGRAQRMIEIAQLLGEVIVIDAASVASMSPKKYEHHRVLLKPEWSKGRRHLGFWRYAIAKAYASKPDLIFAENFFTIFPAWLATRMTGAKLVYDAYELILPDPQSAMSLRNRVWYGFERFAAPRADLVIAANPERAEIMVEHYGLRQFTTFMRNIPDCHVVTAKQREVALKEYPELRRRSEDDRILLYQGDVSLARGLGRFVDVLEYLPENYRLIIVGDGPDLERLTAMAAQHAKTGRFVALGRIPNDKLPAITVHCDIGIVTYRHEGLNNIYCAPNKVFEYAQAGLSIIASNQPPLCELLDKFKAIQTFAQNDSAEDLSEHIMDMIDKKTYLKAELGSILQKNNSRTEVDRVLCCIRKII